ncbi:2-deoxy-D-gluconate 3-dehydrogenase [Alteromonas sp. KUL42]|uniref:SDR family oxidoreductase n=1 Tax=Alteromonas sp. KUL42 TaxID=2480797 RepID=UPI0010FFC5AE|nr:SDR family oxidoreductase [Alteromonas sp. KUL42]GEA06017.1 2-deoxy-D-gluconate 3-dehydrogenase [Alteromonas sp. KUL42]
MTDTHDIELSRFAIDNKVIVVTGCTGVLGQAYCKALSLRGAKLVMADLAERSPVMAASQLSQETGTETLGVVCDVSNESDVVSLFERALSAFGRVDVVLNNAAATGEHLMREGDVFADFESYPLEVWEKVLNTNLTGMFLVAREGGKAMLLNGGGSMINVSSIYGVVAPDHRLYDGMPFRSFAAYSAAKAGVHGLTQWLSTYWGEKAIRVNTLVPGGVNNGHSDTFKSRYAQRTPMNRMAEKDDLVGMVIYLSSEASRYCTGQKFIVDGGLTAW